MNNMNSQMNYHHEGNPYHTFENVYTANHEHVVAPNMHDHMNMPNHYHTGKKDKYSGHYPHHHSAYPPFPNQHDPFSHVPMKDHHHHGHYGGYGMMPYHPYGYQDMHMMMPNQQMPGFGYGMNQPNAHFPRYY
ncbi:hypothetical protein MHH54_08445 [Bacillus sp. FSL K6-4563]|uniref:hypothetical protein n=1 Tax=Bacillus TaxID=1386 RepID=UPI00017A620E|nr:MULTISPECIES: hypothetical protein [Bacillus]EDW23061.1 conserved hypothetical protein [Bacillus pumilus ATCC 7061]KMY19598.1 hypothetical protein TW93_11855 [Bacillus pumilus]MCI4616756.1 hypothetical protein [Bacillus pumilus]MCM3147670.1 hypothetical protein [Bacillus pumilus]MCP1530083.1 hypothetical protein [Bacillus pumilus]